MRLSERTWGAVTLVLLIVLVFFLYSARVTHASGYDADDTRAAIAQASANTGVSYGWLYSTVRCETAGTFNPYAIGAQGELGAAQLHPRGELPRFYDYGYDDPYNPYEAVEFMARRFNRGGSGAWSCA